LYQVPKVMDQDHKSLDQDLITQDQHRESKALATWDQRNPVPAVVAVVASLQHNLRVQQNLVESVYPK
jgi:hypothetical protein